MPALNMCQYRCGIVMRQETPGKSSTVGEVRNRAAPLVHKFIYGTFVQKHIQAEFVKRAVASVDTVQTNTFPNYCVCVKSRTDEPLIGPLL